MAETTNYSTRKFFLLLQRTLLLLGSTYPVKDSISHIPFLPPHSYILLGPFDCSLWNVNNPIQDEIIKYQIHNPPQIGSAFWTAECCQCSRGIWGDLREIRSNQREERTYRSTVRESHPIDSIWLYDSKRYIFVLLSFWGFPLLPHAHIVKLSMTCNKTIDSKLPWEAPPTYDSLDLPSRFAS